MPPQDLCALLRVARWIAPSRIFDRGHPRARRPRISRSIDAEIYTLDLPREMAGGLDEYIPKEAALLQPKGAIGRHYRNESFGRIHTPALG